MISIEVSQNADIGIFTPTATLISYLVSSCWLSLSYNYLCYHTSSCTFAVVTNSSIYFFLSLQTRKFLGNLYAGWTTTEPIREPGQPPPQDNVSKSKHIQLFWSNFWHVINELLFPRNFSPSFGSYVSLQIKPPTETVGSFPSSLLLEF